MKKQLLFLSILLLSIGINARSTTYAVSRYENVETDGTTRSNVKQAVNSAIDENYRRQIIPHETDFTIETLWDDLIILNGNDEYFPSAEISKNLMVLNSEARLDSLTIPGRELTPLFNREIFNYSLIVGLEVETITINATPYGENASISENSSMGEQNLEIGNNEFTITVIAEDGITTQEYIIVVIRKHIDATLASLSVYPGELTPEFDPDITEYYLNSHIDFLSITAVPNDENSRVIGTGNRQVVYGRNTFIITVFAEDLVTTRTYTLTVDRSAQTHYPPSINGHNVSSSDMLLGIGMGETYIRNTFNISHFEQDATITTIYDIEHIFLNIEHSYLGDLIIYITCPNNQRCVLKAYTTTNPSGLTNIATPGSMGGGSTHLGFSPDPASSNPCYLSPGAGMYYWFTPTGTNSFGTGGPTTPISYTDTCGNTESWQQLNSGEYGSYENLNSLIGCPVNGDWSITITDNLAADNGYLFKWGITFAEYIQPVTSTDTLLLNISVSEGILSPGFNPQILEYTVNVEPSIETIEISAVTNSIITEDSDIGEQNLNYGENEFHITVITEDSISSITYTINVYRRPISFDATLADLFVSNGEFTPEFDPDITEYTINVGPYTSNLIITAIPNDENSIVTGDGNVALIYGRNIFEVSVLAEDRTTTRIYTLNIERDSIIPPLHPEDGYTVSDTTLTLIPDGNGGSIISTINIDRFEEDATITTSNDIERFFMNIEHSYLGDLSMSITCPNEQKCVLKAYNSGNPSGVTNVATPGSTGGGNIHLGFSPDPAESDPCHPIPGEGLNYWFTPTGIDSFGNGGPTVPITYTDPCGNTQSWQQLRSGEFGSYENFNSLIGCPLNGDWTIKITDHLRGDNGYLFKWGITFAEHLQQVASTDASLSNITLSEGELNPGFNPQTFDYTVNVRSSIENIEISAITTSIYAVITEDSNIGVQNLNHGENEFYIITMAEDGITSLTYTIIINRQIPDEDATLSNIEVSEGELIPGFDSQTFNYTVNVRYNIETIEISATTTDNYAIITENSNIGEQDLNYGENEFNITVIAEDSITSLTYTIIVTREIANGDATLAGLFVSVGEFTPEFDPFITEYYMDVDSNIDNLIITAIPNYENSIVTGDGHVTLVYGSNIFEISVLAEDITTKIYTLNIERNIIISPLPPTNGHNFSDTTLTLIPDGSGVDYIKTINIDRFEEDATISSLDDVERIFLNIEHSYLGDLSMYITCPNNQRCVLKAYTTTNPSGLTNIATPGSMGGGSTHLGFSPDPASSNPCYLTPGVGMYYWFTATGINSFGPNGPTTSISYGDPCGKIETWQQLNSGEYGSYENLNSLIGCPLNGDWTFTITDNIGSDNGCLFEWGITFDEHLQQVASTNASLFNITVSQGVLSPDFDSQMFDYTVNVGSDIENIEISATTISSYAIITEDSNIGVQNLNHGENEFHIITIAEDRVTSLTYTIIVNREMPGDDATLTDITVSEGELIPEFNPEIFEYNVYVDSEVDIIEISAITTDSSATIIETKSTIRQTLDYGPNILKIDVLAEDEITIKTYTIIVTRGYNNITDNEVVYFSIYPNPAKNYINLDLTDFTKIVTVKITDALNKICYEQKLQGGITHEISTEHLAKGVYFVSINNKIVKLVIE